MNKPLINKLYVKVLALLFFITMGLIVYKIKLGDAVMASPKIKILKTNSITIDKNVKKLALLGSTPHPTNFLEKQTENFKQLKNIKLEHFLDIKDFKDSFEQIIKLCIANNIGQLVIAYLPIHFIQIKKQLNTNYIAIMTEFLDNISLQVIEIIRNLAKQLKYQDKITLILPTEEALAQIPSKSDFDKPDSDEERIRYLIKQFPKIRNINQSDLEEIVIINNQDSDQNTSIINYLKYRHLFDKKVNYKVLNICKTKFHKYL